MAAFWLFGLLYFLFYTFTSPHPTLLPIFSNGFLILQNSDGFVIFVICLPISADNPESICREMQLNSDSGVPYTLLAPPTVQDKKAGKHNSKN